MITDYGISQLLEKFYELAERADLVMEDDSVEALPIIDKKIEDNILKIYFQAANGFGNIKSIIVKDKEGNAVIEKHRKIFRSQEYGLIASIWIEFKEKEVEFFIRGEE